MKLIIIDPNLDWDFSAIQSLNISVDKVEFVFEIPLLTFHSKFRAELAKTTERQLVTAILSFPNVKSFNTKSLELETEIDENGKREFGEIYNVYQMKNSDYIVRGPLFEVKIQSNPPELHISEPFLPVGEKYQQN